MILGVPCCKRGPGVEGRASIIDKERQRQVAAIGRYVARLVAIYRPSPVKLNLLLS